jgi:branched-chain amino acid transport system substrate-binding protein
MGCSEKSFKVGFISDLSTRNSQLGIDARNAVTLLIEEINSTGGINGKTIELIVKDNQSDVDYAIQQHQSFIDEDVKLVIGHLKSSMVESINQSQSDQLMFFSPSISTDNLSMRDDYFLRTSPINSRQAEILSEYFHHKNIDKLTVVYDENNAEYTVNLVNALERIYHHDGYRITQKIGYNSSTDDLEEVLNNIKSNTFENILFVSQASDTAYFLQSLKRDQFQFNAFSVSWSMTHDLIELGGSAVEDIIFVGTYTPEHETDAYGVFRQKYFERFETEPTFISVLAYDAALVLFKGIEVADSDEPKAVKEAILKLESFDGLNESFKIDEYGDNNRQYLLYKLENNEFVPLRKW